MSIKRLVLIVAVLALLGAGYYSARRILDIRKLRAADKDLFVTGDFQSAIANYTDLIRRYPDNAGLYFKRGDAFVQTGRFNDAIDDYRSSLHYEIDDSLQTRLRIGLAQKSLRDWPAAKQTFKDLLNECSSVDSLVLWAAHYHLGQVEYKFGDYREALLQYGHALRFSDTKLTLYHRANAYTAIGLNDSAVADYNASIAFVKHDYVRDHPGTSIDRCDTCGFPFGSKEYDLLTERTRGTLLELIRRAVQARAVQGDKEDLD